MKIPKTIKLGRYTYRIHQPDMIAKTAVRGCIEYGIQTVHIAKKCNVTMRKFTPKERAETFWHELTHAILFDMGSGLAYDEKFVTAFSKRLNDAIHSAEF